MANFNRSGGLKKSNDSVRLIITTIMGMVFGYFIGISFPSVSLSRINLPSSLMSFHEDILKPSDRSFPENLGSGNTPKIPKIYVPTNPRGAETLPPGIVVAETDYMLRRLWGDPTEDIKKKPKYLVTFTVGFDQRNNIDAAVKKFSEDFQILLFHYDGRTSEWDQFEWSKRAVHISIRKQTKWWYAKRFLHPDVVAAYDYIFIWDEDLGVEHFNGDKFIELVKKHGLEISQPGLEPNNGLTWQMTKRRGDREVHKNTEERPGWCSDPHLPPCAAFVEIMAPVFSRQAWRCVWHMIQNDLVHGWGLNVVESKTPKRVLILMSDTGGGHRASAEAIKAAFNQEFGDKYQVFVTDLWADHTPCPFNQLPRSYNFLVKHGSLWRVTYYGSAPKVIHQPYFAITSAFVAREVATGLMKYQPDVIISVHPLMQHVPLRILRSKGLLDKIVFTTVITDLSTCHPTWFHKLVTRCYCPTNEVAKRALKAGLEHSQIKIYGLPVRPSFVKAVRPKDELRKDLGMDLDLPAVLLMGGGEGMGPIEATARALGDSLYDENLGGPVGQVLVVCGRNKKLASRLSAIDWKIPVQVKGFVTKMEECMEACDCIITKAGPGTIAEAMIRGLPIILNDYIAGQEVGNVPYVVENGWGKFSKSPKEIASIVSQWFGPKADELHAMSQKALRLARPDAVFKIVHDLDELVRQKSLVPQYSMT